MTRSRPSRGFASPPFPENESGAELERPELFRPPVDCEPGDVLLVKQVDRLSRLTSADWNKPRAEIDGKRVRIMALDLPTSWGLAASADEFTGRCSPPSPGARYGPRRNGGAS